MTSRRARGRRPRLPFELPAALEEVELIECRVRYCRRSFSWTVVYWLPVIVEAKGMMRLFQGFARSLMRPYLPGARIRWTGGFRARIELPGGRRKNKR